MRISKEKVFDIVDQAQKLGLDIGFCATDLGIKITNKEHNRDYTERLEPREAYRYLCGLLMGVTLRNKQLESKPLPPGVPVSVLPTA